MSTCHKDKKISKEQQQLLDEALGKVYDIGFENGRRFQADMIWLSIAKGEYSSLVDLQTYLRNIFKIKEQVNDKR